MSYMYFLLVKRTVYIELSGCLMAAALLLLVWVFAILVGDYLLFILVCYALLDLRLLLFFCIDTETYERYTLSLPDALPISHNLIHWNNRFARRQSSVCCLP